MEVIKDKLKEIFVNDTILDWELSSFTQNVVLQNRSEIPPLFRFSAADYYNIRGLETESLFLSPAGSMNDVFEGLTCEITDKIINNIDAISNLAYLKSFSEDSNNLLMWAHYANNYSGMCVEYDFSKLPKELIYHLFPVIYSNKRHPNSSLEFAISDLYNLKSDNDATDGPQDDYFWLKDTMHLFLNKSEVWSYEKEWRIVVTYPQLYNEAEDLDDEQNKELYKVISQKISIKDCIKAVYLGPKMKKDIKTHIVEICKERLNNTPVFSSKLSATEYKLEFTRINE